LSSSGWLRKPEDCDGRRLPQRQRAFPSSSPSTASGCSSPRPRRADRLDGSLNLQAALEARQPPLPPWPTTGVSLENYVTLTALATACGIRLKIASTSRPHRRPDVIVSLLAGLWLLALPLPLQGPVLRLILSTIMIPFQSILTPIFLILTGSGCRTR